MTAQEMRDRIYWILNGKWLDWLAEEPNVKDENWQQANTWGDEYIEKHLPERCKAEDHDDDVANLLYEHAVSELEDCTEAFNSLSGKCNDLMKLLVTVVGAFLAIWRYATSVDSAQKFDPLAVTHSYSLGHNLQIASNVLAAVAILCFIAAMVVLITCLRGQPYIPTVGVRRMIDWAGEDKECAAYIKKRAAIRMCRAIVGNRNTNNWIHHRMDIAWIWTVVGLVIIAFSVVLRLFA